MNFNAIPDHVKTMFRKHELNTNQKMVAMVAYVPGMGNMFNFTGHDELGVKIKKLVEDGKIRLGKFDKNFILDVETKPK
jgi:hypothetical protein